MRRTGWAAAALLATLALTSPAAAAPDTEVGIEDERLLLEDPAAAAVAVRSWATLGVDVVRVHARWGSIAPTLRPPGFRAGDPAEPAYRWGHLDHAIDLVRAAGMDVMLTVTGPGPLWTSAAPAKRNPRWKPDPRMFAEFSQAVARRYRDRVDRYLVWNEPNIPGWLDPQMECRRVKGRRTCTPFAPHHYRRLLQAAAPAIKAADPGAQIIAGELAPIGRPPRTERSSVPPLTFFRAMACVDERFRRMPARGHCRGFRPVAADAIGHHPHGVLAAPDEPSEDPNWAKLADLGRLTRTLDRLTAMRRMIAPDGRFDVHLTEFGYQTSPPDHAVGITLEQQTRYLQQAAYIAWRNPRVRSLVHYQWEDEPVRFRAPGVSAYAGWQSGLHFVDGRPKPALRAFESPFVVDEDSAGGRFWGQVRPGGRHVVTLLRRRPGTDFAAVATVATDQRGYWVHDMPVEAAAEYRFRWEAPR